MHFNEQSQFKYRLLTYVYTCALWGCVQSTTTNLSCKQRLNIVMYSYRKTKKLEQIVTILKCMTKAITMNILYNQSTLVTGT